MDPGGDQRGWHKRIRWVTAARDLFPVPHTATQRDRYWRYRIAFKNDILEVASSKPVMPPLPKFILIRARG